ncbi:NADH-quinone oxidoreductase subunit J [Pseudonocardia sp. KRD-184]|uniref:NADH-quinone oxidoreductase subunit J n=1 Tax=Pseudonocardia oceani TaxID=2792013 RepID=A0ABS6UH96_9PSEU|nr:NADH-quinone oxidoreductase subunit J [Pseudonocardia oceani]MBW0090319.1 NADH-quinone oxidoreductase subunit J [Pseudonocardia oceani]MBW0097495.1 NADH-quinone oxidoreductase subunit J [Pseudonocardia oceani]MBW0112172.1 NADH-quinone oxidoreductase subunit J [Pseudonocardia oceani]MBW0123498.1 NADH-quinone oxidoreductase subunit J [Pseudonocardia oceani]MBW0131278.1 NADH-quinone oxidoreductase subunit J [Pseudonocardia oceani]
MSAVTAVSFWVLAVLAVSSGVLVFLVDSMARATYALAVSFVAVGLAVSLLGLEYVGVVVVLMMVMEMAVMAVFMVMFMGMNPALMPMSMVHGNRTAVIASGAVFLLLGGGALLVPWPVRRGVPAAEPTAALGHALMGSHMLVMMVVSAVMLATVVAGIALAAPRGRYDRFGDDLDRRPPDDPQPGGVGR